MPPPAPDPTPARVPGKLGDHSPVPPPPPVRFPGLVPGMIGRHAPVPPPPPTGPPSGGRYGTRDGPGPVPGKL